MKNSVLERARTALLVTLTLVGAACGLFEDQSPDNISLRLAGSNGLQVQAIYSTEFVAGVDERGVTQVSIFRTDTVMQTLPIDTTVSIAQNQQFFIQIQPMPSDTLDVEVQVQIDGREVLNNSGFILPTQPWRYVYQFNQLLTQAIEVVI